MELLSIFRDEWLTGDDVIGSIQGGSWGDTYPTPEAINRAIAFFKRRCSRFARSKAIRSFQRKLNYDKTYNFINDPVKNFFSSGVNKSLLYIEPYNCYYLLRLLQNYRFLLRINSTLVNANPLLVGRHLLCVLFVLNPIRPRPFWLMRLSETVDMFGSYETGKEVVQELF
jgi:hypothetical protein